MTSQSRPRPLCRFRVCVKGVLVILSVLLLVILAQEFFLPDEYIFEEEELDEPELDLHGPGSDSVELRSQAEREVIPYPVIIWWTGFTRERGRVKECGRDRCFFTADRHYQNHNSTAVFVFYGTDYKVKDLPLPRRPHHEWALLHEESPKNNYLFSHGDTLELFNHTSTFKRQSDFPLTTQYLKKLSDLDSTEYLQSFDRKNELMAAEDLAMVAYIQSDCEVPSDRDHFVQMLQRHIKVDSYGKCEHNRDLPEDLRDPISGMEHVDFYKFLSKYKFVLAIENAECTDYVTEKFWRPFLTGSVPIVLESSGARDWLPTPDSALFVEDYSSVREFVDVLVRLNNSRVEYERMLSYKQTGVTNRRLRDAMATRKWAVGDVDKPNFIDGFECHICQKLHANIARKAQGQPLEPHRADISHYGCPRPQTFSDHPAGDLTRVEGGWWFRVYDQAERSAKKTMEKIVQNKS